MKQPKILIIGGLGDLEMAGNQVFKNTIYYFLKSNFRVAMTTAIPANYPNRLEPKIIFGELSKNYQVFRLPKIFQKIFYLIRSIKNLFKRKNYQKNKNSKYSLKSKDYFADYTLGAQFIYFLGWFLYQIFGTIQGIFITIKEKSDLFYGFEIYGARIASILGFIFRKPVITRFMGTALDINQEKKWRRYYLYHILGLKSPSNAIVIANDGTRGKEVLQKLGVNSNKIHFWMDGLDSKDMELDQRKITEIKQKLNLEHQKVLLCVSKLKIWKRIDRAIYVLHKLINDYGLENTVLVIVGDGSEMENLRKIAENYNINNKIKFVGAVSHSEIANYFSIADLFLMVSDITNLGNQLMEALYFSCPIIALKDESTDEILKNGYNSLLVPLDQIKDSLPRMAYNILTDKKLTLELSKNAKKTAKNKILSWRERMEKEIQLINYLIRPKI